MHYRHLVPFALIAATFGLFPCPTFANDCPTFANDIGECDSLLTPSIPAGGLELCPEVAFNPDRGEYFVVWSAFRLQGGLFTSEIVGRVFQAGTGKALGATMRISKSPTDLAREASVVYNSVQHEYFVVWRDVHPSQSEASFELFGRRIGAASLKLLGGGPVQISDVADDGSSLTSFFGGHDVAYTPVSDEYLVV